MGQDQVAGNKEGSDRSRKPGSGSRTGHEQTWQDEVQGECRGRMKTSQDGKQYVSEDQSLFHRIQNERRGQELVQGH